MTVLIIISIAFLFTVFYAVLLHKYGRGWLSQEDFVLAEGYIPTTRISIIIPARDEEQNIAACINSALAQDYPKELYEVIVVDDHSTDKTAGVVRSFNDDRVKYINLADHVKQDENIVAFKKLALSAGIAQSKGTLIVTTDADCVAGKYWLKNIAAKYEQEQPSMIVAPVDYVNNNTLLQVFQSLDFMSMQGITAASLKQELGYMCNGANLAYTRAAYDKVNGYEETDHIASGDDYLLMMKIRKAIPGSIAYLKSTDAIVRTLPQPSLKALLQQRIRWASKSGKYDDKKLTVILASVYLYNLVILIMGVACFFYPSLLRMLIGLLVFKSIVELIFLQPVSVFFSKQKQLYWFPLFQLPHILYIIVAGFFGIIGVYKWKGRVVK